MKGKKMSDAEIFPPTLLPTWGSPPEAGKARAKIAKFLFMIVSMKADLNLRLDLATTVLLKSFWFLHTPPGEDEKILYMWAWNNGNFRIIEGHFLISL
jgi:hypothetical protein